MVSDILLNDARHVRVDELIDAFNSATLAMQKAMTHEEIFAVMSSELGKMGLSCVVFPADKNQTKLFTKYLSYDPKLVALAESLVGIKHEDFFIPVRAVNGCSEVFHSKIAIFHESFEALIRQVLPKAVRKFSSEIVELLRVNRSITAPMIAQDEVIGVLAVQSNDLTEEDIPTIVAFAHQAAAAWYKAELLQDLERELAERNQVEKALKESEKKYRKIIEEMEEGYFEVDLEGNFIFFNQKTCQTLGYTPDEMSGMNFRTLLDTRNARKVMVAFHKVYKSGGSIQMLDWEISSKDGARITVEASIYARKDVFGNPVSFYGVVRDITERKYQESLQSALYEIARAADLADTLDDLYQEIHKIIQGVMPVENFYIALYDAERDTISYPYFLDEFEDTPAPHKSARGTTEYVLRTGKSLLRDLDFLAELEQRGEATLVGPPSLIWLGVPLIVEGNTIGAMVVQHYSDPLAYGEREQRMLEFVSTQVAHAIESKQKEEALLKSDRRLAKAQQIACLGHWENDLVNGEIFWSDEVFRIHKYPKELGTPVKNFNDVLELIHPDDREESLRAHQNALNGNNGYTLDRRIICGDGEVRWVHIDVELQRDDHGNPIRMFGITQDITDRKKAEGALREAEAQTRSRLEEQTTLRKAISIISSTLDPPVVFNHIVGEMCAAIGCTSGYIRSYNSQSQELTTIAEYYSLMSSQKEGESILGEIYREDNPKFIETMKEGRAWIDYIDNPDMSDYLRGVYVREGACSILYIPLFVAGEFSAFIELWESRCHRKFTPEEIAMCEDIAQYAAVAIENANLFQIAQSEIEERRQTEENYRQLIDNSLIGIFISKDKVIQFCNQRYAEIYGYMYPEELIGMPIDNLVASDDLNRVYDEIESRTLGEKPFSHYQYKGIRKDSTIVDIEVWAIQCIYQDEPATQGAILDITERIDSEKRLEYLATHDLMTNLPNRLLFHDRLRHALEIAKQNEWIGAVVYLDLDDFKMINDAYKHELGDMLLRMVAERLRRFTRKSDTVSRFGGDEFAILLENLSDPENVKVIADKILRGLAEPYVIDQIPVFITTSMGISVFPNNGKTISELLQNADIAMYQAKKTGNTYKFYSPEMSDEVIDNIELGNFLRGALEHEDLYLRYQPQYNITTGEVIGFEALARLNNSEIGNISPKKFIPIAEKNGTIVAIGEWVLERACETAFQVAHRSNRTFRIAVNISAVQIKQPHFLDMIKRTLEKTKLAPQFLELEITENSFFDTYEEIKEVMEALRAVGVRLAMDDFGTGYSSLSYIANFPLNTLKVDSSFVKNAGQACDIAIVEGIATIANGLGMDLIVEGVETEAQLTAFTSKGCDLVQGWYFSKDVPESELESVLKKGVQRPVTT
jgi:diguanylate cyclase (GGDEF)-like protein/PAS domain S-box-containing protein